MLRLALAAGRSWPALVASNNGWHHRGIDHAQPFGAENPELGVDDTANPTGARRMIIRACSLLDKRHDVSWATS